MSNTLAIAAVSTALKKRLESGLLRQQDNLAHAWAVTVSSPDVARTTALEAQDQLNLFLYQASASAAWRNQEVPGRNQRGETVPPPLALDLHYLVTAYAPDDEGIEAQKLLGIGGGILHDTPLLSREELESALASAQVHLQPERIRITSQNLSLDELSKLWTMFQKPYRTSLAFMVSVVLIESSRPSRVPLPVLTIGEGGAGVVVSPSMVAPIPMLLGLRIPGDQPAAQWGDEIILTGHALQAAQITAVLRHVRSGSTYRVITRDTPEGVRFTLPPPADAAGWRAGLYTVKLELLSTFEAAPRETNELAIPVAPTLLNPSTSARDTNQNVTITLTSQPELAADQIPTLLVGGSECRLTSRSGSSLSFLVVNPAPGTTYLRLRVEGTDSRWVDRSTRPPTYIAPTVVIP